MRTPFEAMEALKAISSETSLPTSTILLDTSGLTANEISTRLFTMSRNHQTSRLILTLWVLLLSWAFFGGLVLAEQLEMIPEPVVDSGAPDLDAEALTALGLGLKSSISSLDVPNRVDLAATINELICSVTSPSVHYPKQLILGESPARPLYQQLSIYRI